MGDRIEESRSRDPVWKEIRKLTKSRGLDPSAALPDIVADSWRRCLADYNLSPDAVPRASVLTRAEVVHLTENYEDVLTAAEPEVERLFLQLADSEYLVSFASLQGAMLLFRCDYQLLNDVAACGVLPGSIWTEERQGTNGVGIGLQIGRPVSVVGGQHFGSEIQILTCLTAPVFGKAGSMEGILNVTTPRSGNERTNRLVQNMVEGAARRIEARHFGRVYRRSMTLHISNDPESADLSEEGRLAVDETGRIVAGTNQVARLTGGSLGEIVGRFADQVFDLDLPLWDLRPGEQFRVAINGKVLQGVLLGPKSRIARSPADPENTRAATAATKILRGSGHADGWFKANPATLTALEQGQKLLNAGVPLFVTGESGTGKTSFARTLARQCMGEESGSIILVDCALLNSVSSAAAVFLSGEVKAARFLVLDHFDKLSDSGQDVLLALLDQDRDSSGQIRVIAVGESNPSEGTFRPKAGTFRPHLLNRLRGGSISLAPLRDDPNLDRTIDEFLETELVALNKEGLQLDEQSRLVLKNYHWPGNYPELRSALRHAAALAGRKAIGLEHLPPNIVSQIARRNLSARSESEAAKIEAALRHNGGNLSRTARYLGVSRATLYRKIDIHKIR